MSLFWSVFEISINLYQSFIVIWFIYKFLGAKVDFHSRIWFALAFFLHLLLLSIQNHTGKADNWFTLGYFIINILYAFIFLNGDPVKKILGAMLPLMLLSVVSICAIDFTSFIINISMSKITEEKSYSRLLVLLLVQIFLWLAIKSILYVFSTYNESFLTKDWLMIIIIIILSFLLEVFLHNSLINNTSPTGKLMLNMGLVILLILDIIFFSMVKLIVEKNQRLKEMELVEMRERYHAQYMDITQQQVYTIHKLRHDMKHQFFALRELLAEHKYNEAYNYLLKNEEVLSKTQSIVNTDNNIFNAIINAKLSAASARGININCLSVNNFDGIDDIDLCNLVSNALDNSIRACSENSNGQNSILIDIDCENDVYIFNIKNTISSSILDKNPELKTTKKHIKNHGYGIKIIKDIAEKYGGRCDFYEQGDMFCCQVTLQISKEHSK